MVKLQKLKPCQKEKAIPDIHHIKIVKIKEKRQKKEKKKKKAHSLINLGL